MMSREHAIIPCRADASYDEIHSSFRWRIPASLNIGTLCSDRHPAGRTALIEVAEDGAERSYTFGQLAIGSNRLANALRGQFEIEKGDRVAIVLPQSVETGLAHLACYKLGAVALPLSGLFGPDALEYRLGDSEARVVITDSQHLEMVGQVAAQAGASVICTGTDGTRPSNQFWEQLKRGAATFTPPACTPKTPALLIYTSGTTGTPKGTLHGHGVLHGHLPGFELSHNFFGAEDDRFWTPADWAWIGGLMDALIPTWFHGRTIVSAQRARFDPDWAMKLIEDHQIRNVFLPPTALKMMRQALVAPHPGVLRTIGSGGEMLGDEILTWTSEHLGVTVNEFYGQTEANLVIGNCNAAWDVRPGSMGRPYPGHELAILRADGSPATPGEIGQVAVQAPDPVMFLEYWHKPEETREKFTADGRWLLTGDLAQMDDDGYYWYSSRDDDVITSAGYRIGPSEIESCLLRHDAVANAAAIGVPDPLRGEIVKVFIVPTNPVVDSRGELESDIREFVRSRLATYLYPRDIEFVPELPMTTSGKVRRRELRERELAVRSTAQPGLS
jgi:acetyl-CoA synthetase